MRVTEMQEETGLDITQHDETLYERSRVEERVAVS
jgi:ammonia channel protein AmtB